MLVEQIWTGNAYRNFNYLIACPQTGEALAVDPLDHQKCLKLARDKGWDVTQIVNTHEHLDHTGGNQSVVAATGAKVLAHAGASSTIPGVDRGLSGGDIIKIGNSVELAVLDTPGHTMTHVCLLSHSDTPALFCGDTLFNAGAGNCHHGGYPTRLFETFAGQIEPIADDTLIYPGHDYLESNLGFTLSREPNNHDAQKLLAIASNQDPNDAVVTTLAQEKQINTFFRLENAEVIAQLCLQFPELGAKPSRESVFLKLRELRNEW